MKKQVQRRKVTHQGKVNLSFTLRWERYLQVLEPLPMSPPAVAVESSMELTSGLALKAFPDVLRQISCVITVRSVCSVLLNCPTFHTEEFPKVYVGFIVVVVAFSFLGQRLIIIGVTATKSPQRCE